MASPSADAEKISKVPLTLGPFRISGLIAPLVKVSRVSKGQVSLLKHGVLDCTSALFQAALARFNPCLA